MDNYIFILKFFNSYTEQTIWGACQVLTMSWGILISLFLCQYQQSNELNMTAFQLLKIFKTIKAVLEKQQQTYSMVKTLKIRYKDRIANPWVPMNASHHFGVISHLKHIIVICKYGAEQGIKHIISLRRELQLHRKCVLQITL